MADDDIISAIDIQASGLADAIATICWTPLGQFQARTGQPTTTPGPRPQVPLDGGRTNSTLCPPPVDSTPHNQLHAAMLRVVFPRDLQLDDPGLDFCTYARTRSQAASPSPSVSKTPDSPRPHQPLRCHTLSPIAEVTTEPQRDPAQAPGLPWPAATPPAPLSEEPVLTVAPASAQASPPAAVPVHEQPRQQIPRQADPFVPTDPQRLEQLRRDAQAKLAQDWAAADRQETARRTGLRTIAQKQTQAQQMKPADKIGSTPLQNLHLRDFLNLITKAATLGSDLTGALAVLASLLGTSTPLDVSTVLSVEQTSIALEALDQGANVAAARRDIEEYSARHGITSTQQPKTESQAQHSPGGASSPAYAHDAPVPIAAPQQQQGAEVRITLACRDPDGKVLLAYNATSRKYGLPSARVPWTDDFRPAVNKIISSLGMNNTLPVWNNIVVLGSHDSHQGLRLELGVHTEIPGKHSAKQTHNSRFWVAGDKVNNPPQSLPLAHRLSDAVRKFITTSPAAPQQSTGVRSTPAAQTPARGKPRSTDQRPWGASSASRHNFKVKPSPWAPGKARAGAAPAANASVVTIDCTSRCGDRDIPPPPRQGHQPPPRG